MNNQFTFKKLIPYIFLSLILLFSLFYKSIIDDRTLLVFCDVGQGDAAYIRIKNKIDVLIDSGPDNKVLQCLGKYMPFYDRKIEIAILSHPQKDHVGGLSYILDRYQIDKLYMSPIDDPSQAFQNLKRKLADKQIKIDLPRAGDKILILDDYISFFWPTASYVGQNLTFANQNVLGVSSLDDNNFSLICIFEENGYRALFSGDASPLVLGKLSHQSNLKVNLLKVPHHGSKNGLIKEFLQLADPQQAVISVGKNNSYGHPTKEILDMLKAQNIQIKRTDVNGDIVFRLGK